MVCERAMAYGMHDGTVATSWAISVIGGVCS